MYCNAILLFPPSYLIYHIPIPVLTIQDTSPQPQPQPKQMNSLFIVPSLLSLIFYETTPTKPAASPPTTKNNCFITTHNSLKHHLLTPPPPVNRTCTLYMYQKPAQYKHKHNHTSHQAAASQYFWQIELISITSSYLNIWHVPVCASRGI